MLQSVCATVCTNRSVRTQIVRMCLSSSAWICVCVHVSIFSCLRARVHVFIGARVNVQLRMEILHPEPRCLIICMRHSRLHMYAPFLSAASLMAACTLAAHRNGGVQMSAAIIFHVV